MDNIGLTIYLLIWPVIVAGVLVVLSTAFIRDWRVSHRDGEDII